MSEEHLRMLEALGTLAREEQLGHEQLEALCDPKRRAQALQRAGSAPGFEPALMHATQPLSAESHARIVQRVQEALRAQSPAAALADAAPANQNAGTVEPVVKKKRPSARAQPRRVEPRPAPKPLRTWLSVALPLLAAAAGVLLFLDPATGPGTLPEYTLEARASSSYRGEPEARPDRALILPRGGALELELRPDQEFQGELELRVQLQRGDAYVELPAQVEHSASGSLRVRLARAALPVGGEARLLVTLSRPEAQQLVAARDPDALQGEGWQAWRLDVSLP